MPGAIHDPIHGIISLGKSEWAIVDSRPFQRLRAIKQLGFAELAFPGATHTRYAHSLGALAMVTRMFERVWSTLPTTGTAQQQQMLRQGVRLAMLLHDVGHPPLSHVCERLMPKVDTLALPSGWVDGPSGRQAGHEDYTLKLLVDSELCDVLKRYEGEWGITPTLLGSLILGRLLPPLSAHNNPFVVDGLDLLPLLSSLISGELDGDRMDYLRRDAYFCGVSYGQFDHVWLCNAMSAVHEDGALGPAISHRGVWAFENFLLARYHMFLAVYHHHTAICFDHLLGRFFAEESLVLPSDTESYLGYDDVTLGWLLRQAKNPWARAIVARHPYPLVVEMHAYADNTDAALLEARLQHEQIDYFRVDSHSLLSKYFGRPQGGHGLKVIEHELGRTRRIDEYTPLYRRYEAHARVVRFFCRPEHIAKARLCAREAAG